jgi:hypothetical protein
VLAVAGPLPSAWAVADAAAPPGWAPPLEASAALSGADPPCSDAPTAAGVLLGKPSRSHPPRPVHSIVLLLSHCTQCFALASMIEHLGIFAERQPHRRGGTGRDAACAPAACRHVCIHCRRAPAGTHATSVHPVPCCHAAACAPAATEGSTAVRQAVWSVSPAMVGRHRQREPTTMPYAPLPRGSLTVWWVVRVALMMCTAGDSCSSCPSPSRLARSAP